MITIHTIGAPVLFFASWPLRTRVAAMIPSAQALRRLRRNFAGIIACLALLSSAGVVRAQAPAADLTEAEALKTAQTWAALVEAADVAGLETLLHESYTHTHGTGLLESKSRFLEMLQNGERDYVRAVIKDPVVSLFGSTALVKGTLDFKVVLPEKQIEGQNRFMMVLVRTKDGVQVAAYQATLLNRVDTPAPSPQPK